MKRWIVLTMLTAACVPIPYFGGIATQVAQSVQAQEREEQRQQQQRAAEQQWAKDRAHWLAVQRQQQQAEAAQRQQAEAAQRQWGSHAAGAGGTAPLGRSPETAGRGRAQSLSSCATIHSSAPGRTECWRGVEHSLNPRFATPPTRCGVCAYARSGVPGCTTGFQRDTATAD